jgi:hypothetical protein
MKKKLSIGVLLAFLLLPGGFAISNHVFAVDIFNHTCDSATKSTDVCTDVNSQSGGTTAPDPVINGIKIAINIISVIIGVAAVIGVIVSALRMILANGDSNAVASARSGITYSLVGIAVTVLAQAIVIFVVDKLN